MSIKTLRHYHEKGLLVPCRVESESGYRFYGAAEVERAKAISYLKDMTFSLAEIAEILEGFSDESDLVEFLLRKQTSIESKIRHMHTVRSSLSGIIRREQEVKKMLESGQFEIEEKEMDGQLVAIYDWVGRYSETGKAFKALFRGAGRYCCGQPFNLYNHTNYEEGDCEIMSCVPVKKEFKSEGIRFEKMSSGKCYSLIHKGPYHEIGRTYQVILDHLKSKGLEFSLPLREVYLKGPGMILKGNPNNYLTEVQVPVKI